MHLKMLSFALDKADHVAGKEHFHLCEPILEELILRNVASVAEHIYENVNASLEEFHIILMNDVFVDSIREKVVTNVT